MRALRIVQLLGLVAVFLLAGVLPSSGGGQAAVFRSPVFLTLLGVLAVAAAAGCLHPPRRRRVGFLLTHVGIGVLLAGALLGFAFGRKGQMVLPVDVRHAIRQVQEDERSTFDLPFDVTVTKFAVDYYDPDYQVFRPTGAAVTNAADGYAHVTRLSPGKRPTLAVPEYGALPVAELRYAGTEGLESWRRQVALTNGWVLQRARPTARHFEADLRFSDAAAGGNRSLRVNHPVNYGGWRFYLMSHGEEGPPYVVLLARRDPGRPLAVAGIWMLIFGTAMLGFARRRETGPAVPERESGHAA